MPDAADQPPDALQAAALDLERLQALLADAGASLTARFAGASALLRAEPPDAAAARHEIDAAVTALQFQDIAQQLIAHIRTLLARPQRSGPAPAGPVTHAHPVAQSGVAAGSVELF